MLVVKGAIEGNYRTLMLSPQEIFWVLGGGCCRGRGEESIGRRVVWWVMRWNMSGFVTVSVPPALLRKTVAIHRIAFSHKRVGTTSHNFRWAPKYPYLRHPMHCTIATEKSNLKKVPTSSGSPNENSVDEFLAEKGYRVEDSVILFDGECNLCNGSVNFVLDHDRQGIFKFAALQSPVGLALLKKYHGPTDLSSLVLIEKGRMLLKSDAILRIAELLDNQTLRILAVATRVGFPRWMRDWVYTEIISKYRRQIFGETDVCRLMEPGWEHRFL
jgi:predicted DCC family thiol-disulfide oxidoreductase YuxK